jgi:copper ion binding protein
MQTKLNIDGMSCKHCVSAVTEAIKALSGVTKVKVDLKKKTADIVRDESVKLDDIISAVSEAGFKVV